MSKLESPSLLAILREGLSGLEFARLMAASPALALQTRGSGEPVIVLPGLGASNTSTIPLRGYLTWLGYEVQGWTLGRNRGDVRQLLPLVVDQVKQVHLQSGSPVNIIGWSLGGVIAREVAREHPASVRQVITMGSPVVGGAKYTSMGGAFEKRGVDLDVMESRVAARERTPITIPLTSIYSKNDGIVGWQASIDRHNAQVDHIEVRTTHLGLGICPEVFKIIARKLAQP